MTRNNPLDWENHQVDYLFLLIGENPLPNYVAAKTLLREGGKPCLVYTEHTKDAARILQEILNLDENDKRCLGKHESNAFEIRKAIKNKLEEIKDENIKAGKDPSKIRFGLNYTGGTKAMAVHAYQAFLELQLSPEPYFSYLDSSTLKMMFDQRNSLPIPLDVPKNLLNIDDETLFKLHELYWKKDKQPLKEPKLIDISKDLLTIYMNDSKRSEFDTIWLNWCEKVLTPKTQNQNRSGKYIDWKDEKELIKTPEMEFNLDPKAKLLIDIFIKHSLVLDNKLSLQMIKEKGKFQKLYHVCEWLSCGWLEHYVLSEVQKISVNPLIDASAMSFNIIEQPEDEWEKFQFDVAFRRSYQLFAISCTTSRATDRCKEKLFEAYIRAKQLGGSEARVALVCFHKKPRDIVKNFNSLIKDKKIAVFGHKHLNNLSQNITKWIEEKDY